MSDQIRRVLKIVGIFVLFLLTPIVLVLGLFVWDGSDFRMKSVLRDKILREADVAELSCFGHQSGLLETSVIALFKLTPEFSERLNSNGIDALDRYRKSYQRKDWARTSWIVAGNGFDKINNVNGYTSRGFKFMESGNRHSKNMCGVHISKLTKEKAWVSFTHPDDWKIEDCRDSCGAYLIFPESKLAVLASFD